jgi:hypothetical protein
MRLITWRVLVAIGCATVAVLHSFDAQALSFEDIRGKWCGSTADDEFTEKTLRITFHSGSPERTFKITGYEYTDLVITVHWIDANNRQVWTKYSEFSPDRRFMYQQRDTNSARLEFRRC